MTMVRYNIQTGENGAVLIPETPFAAGVEVEVVLAEKHAESPSAENRPSDDGWRPNPEAVRRFHESRKSLPPVEITDEEIEQLKHERRMRKMQ